MSPTKQQLVEMSVPDNKKYVLTVQHHPHRAAILLDHLDEVHTTLKSSGTTKLESLKSQLAYIKRYGKEKGSKITFSTLRKDGSKGWGRAYPEKGTGYVLITRAIRHALAYDLYSDHDIVNCHPELIGQLFETYTGTPNINLTIWNDNREEFFKIMMRHSKGRFEYDAARKNLVKVAEGITRDDCKGLGFCFLYEGNVDWRFKLLGLSTKEPEIESIYDVASSICADIISLRSKIIKDLGDTWDLLPHDESKGKDRSAAGKFSALIQHYERHIMLICKEVATQSGFGIGDLAHDGLFLSKDGKPAAGPEVEEFYRLAEQAVLQKTGFKIKLLGKALKCPEWCQEWFTEEEIEETEEGTDSDLQDYAGVLAWFNEKYCKIGFKNCWIYQSENGPILLNKAELCHATAELKYHERREDDKGKPYYVTMAFTGAMSPYWSDSNKHMKDHMGIYPPPLACPNNVYNLWVPYAADLDTAYIPKVSERDRVLRVLKVLCNNEDTVYEYMLDWVAQLVQYPGTKTTMPTFISKEGAGKGFFATVLTKMLGKRKILVTTNPGRDVWGNFNEQMAEAMVVILNEIEKRDTVDGKERLKAIITDPTMVINPKGKTPYEINSYHRVIGFTNNLDPMPVSESNRRNIIIRSSDELIGLKSYWSEMFGLLDDFDVIRTLFDYFKTRKDIDKFHTRTLPETEHSRELKEMSKSLYEQWLQLYVEEKVQKEPNLASFQTPVNDMFELFQSWVSSCKLDWKGTNRKFNTNLKLLAIPGLIYKEKGGKDPNRYLIMVEEIRIHWGEMPAVL